MKRKSSIGRAIGELGECPVCHYSLQGLPSEHRCPECGFQYDEQTFVWRPKDWIGFAGGRTVVLATSLIVLITVAWFLGIAARGLHRWTDLIRLFAGVSGGAYLIGFVVSYRRRPFLAVTPIGLVIRTGSSPPYTLPWNEVWDVSWTENASTTYDVAILETAFLESGWRKGERKKAEMPGVAQSKDEANRLVAEIKAGLERYRLDLGSSEI